SAQQGVPEREGEEDVGVENDDEGRGHHAVVSATQLLRLGVVSSKFLGNARELSQPGASIPVPSLLEREHILDAESAVLASLAEGNPPFVEQPYEVLAGDVQEIGRL